MKGTKQKKRNVKAEAGDSAELVLPVYDSMSHCAGDLEIPIGALRHAKKSGCKAFDGSGRVRTKALIKFLFLKDESGIDYGSEFKKWQALREKIKHDKDAGEVADKGEVRTWMRSFMALLFGELDRIFGMELPASGKGLSEAELKRRADVGTEQLKTTLRKRFQEQL